MIMSKEHHRLVVIDITRKAVTDGKTSKIYWESIIAFHNLDRQGWDVDSSIGFAGYEELSVAVLRKL